jgi:coenzyme F420-reducing hydrogenase delta subunit/Pyruvate/2-oxoacid:ferredoxin oxidoreductase delta subunit
MDLERVLVAGCTPRTLAPRLRAACREGGLDGNLFHMVDIREGCAWVHGSDPSAASEKALDLIRAGIAAVCARQRYVPASADVVPRALVIGGGLAGLTAAHALADAGVPVTLVERQAHLGGGAGERAEAKAVAVRDHGCIEVLTRHEVTAVAGGIGRYAVSLAVRGNGGPPLVREVGAIIVATGACPAPVQGAPSDAGAPVVTDRLAPQPDAGVIAYLLRLRQDADGFFVAERRRLRPENVAETGIYVCGAAHGTATPREAELEALSVAYGALRHLRAGRVISQAPVASVTPERCTGCGTCVTHCPAAAITLHPGEGLLSVARVDALRCQACGGCTAACPAGAIDLYRASSAELFAAIEAVLASGTASREPRILVLGCEWSGHAAAELAGARRLPCPPQTRLIAIPCSARVSPMLLLWAFHCGADGVLVAACPPSECHHGQGNRHALERVSALQQQLRGAGFDPRRLRLEWLSPDDAQGFVARVRAFTDLVCALGPGPLRAGLPSEASLVLASEGV